MAVYMWFSSLIVVVAIRLSYLIMQSLRSKIGLFGEYYKKNNSGKNI